MSKSTKSAGRNKQTGRGLKFLPLTLSWRDPGFFLEPLSALLLLLLLLLIMMISYDVTSMPAWSPVWSYHYKTKWLSWKFLLVHIVISFLL